VSAYVKGKRLCFSDCSACFCAQLLNVNKTFRIALQKRPEHVTLTLMLCCVHLRSKSGAKIYICLRFLNDKTDKTMNVITHCCLLMFVVSYVACSPNRLARQAGATCSLGTPLKDGKNRVQQCTPTANNCPTNHQCNGGVCCQSPAAICRLSYDLGQPCSNRGTRYYWNPPTRSCRTFQYVGCGGNLNNFLTEQDCRAFCASS